MEKPIKPGQCSYYVTKNAKQNTVVTIAQFITAIRSDRWKDKAEEYRSLMARGDKRGAKFVKELLPCLVVAGICMGGHAKVNFVSFSGYLMIDIDHYPGNIAELKEILKAQPWCYAVWITISGEGLKVVIRVDAVTQDEYEKVAYPLVAAHIRKLIDFPVDMQCGDLTRTCFSSYDADAYCCEGECEVYPWREVAQAAGITAETVEAAAGTPKTAKTTQSTAQGMVHSFLESFLESYPYVPNHRHKFQLALGREARRYGMNEEELNQLIDLAVSKLSMPDSDGPEIKANILDAYYFAEEKKLETNRRKGFMGSWGHRVPSAAYTDDETDPMEAEDANREIRLSSPYLPDWIFDCLPEIFRQGLEVVKDFRQRDMLLLGMLTNLSGCLPNVRMVYDDADVFPHLFLAVIASAASGKGILAHAAKLAREVQKMLEAENEARMREFEEAQILWEQERSRAAKELRKPDMKLKPEPMKQRTLIVPADTSRTRLIQLMSGSPQGVLLNVSEMDTIRAAMNAEYGRFDDLMRACFHHEMFGSDFKQDKQQYMVYCPKMAFCASGTPSQFYHLCPSPENGAYSRYLIYMAEQDTDFRRMAPNGDKKNKDKVFRELAAKVMDIYRYLLARPTEVMLTPDQWDWHQAFFQSALQDVQLEGSESAVSVVFRHGLNTARLAMILTALRKYEAQWDFYEMKCTDEDFRIAMAIMEVLLQHSLTLSTSLRTDQASPGEMHQYFRVRAALEKLNPEFRYHELMDSLRNEGMSDATAKRVRKRLLKMELIVQEGNVYRFSNRKWRAQLENGRGDLGTR